MGPLLPIGLYELIILVAFGAVAITSILVVLILIWRRRQSQAVKFDNVQLRDLIKLFILIGFGVAVCLALVFMVFQNNAMPLK